MYINRLVACALGAVIIALCIPVTVAIAQSDQQPPVSTPAATAQHTGHDLASMTRDGSGTSWLPDASPIYGFHQQKGAWMLMEHENAFLQFLHESADRGGHQAGSINWVMAMAGRSIGRGRLLLSGMVSFEPWTIRGCGYPNLLASGEFCRGAKIHDLQHPHDLAMEMAAEYDAPAAGSVRWQVYGGPAGEPALGPVAFPHRVSATPNPVAPITHHWLDSTHVTFGVVTGGLYASRWKVEASAFNGREPDDDRTNFEFAALDSFAARVWFLPTPSFALQVSAGHLNEAEASDHGGPRTDVAKATASVTYHKLLPDNGIWATTAAWGRNSDLGRATNAWLLETNLTLDEKNTWFGRFEMGAKTAHDLAVVMTSDDAFTIAKLQGGFTRYLNAVHGFRPGVGMTMSGAIVPVELDAAYGRRVNLGVGVFATLRPSALAGTASARSNGRAMVMVQTALDPAKLVCAPPIDPKQAVTATYQGVTYYFCSARERDEFLTDPAMSLSMMPPRQ